MPRRHFEKRVDSERSDTTSRMRYRAEQQTFSAGRYLCGHRDTPPGRPLTVETRIAVYRSGLASFAPGRTTRLPVALRRTRFQLDFSCLFLLIASALLCGLGEGPPIVPTAAGSGASCQDVRTVRARAGQDGGVDDPLPVRGHFQFHRLYEIGVQ